MELKSEESVVAYLKTLPDDTIIRYYLDVEYSPFPVLILREYQRRFKEKSKFSTQKRSKIQCKDKKECFKGSQKNKGHKDIIKGSIDSSREAWKA